MFVNCLAHAQSERWFNAYHYGGETGSESSDLWINGNYTLNSNRLQNALMADAAFRQRIAGDHAAYLKNEDPTSNSMLYGGIDASAWLRLVGEKQQALHIGAGVVDASWGKMKTGLVQLALTGNGPYEDLAMPLGPSYLNRMSYQFVGIGMDHRHKEMVMGITASLIKLSRLQSLEISTGNMYTAPYGQYIDAELNGRFVQSGSAQATLPAWYGTGAGINAFWVLLPGEGKTYFSIELSNLGLVHLSGSRVMDIEFDTVYSGLEITNILDPATAPLGGGSLDSLPELLGVTRYAASHLQALPATLRIDLVRTVGERLSAAISLKQWIQAISPELRLGLSYKPVPAFSVEPYIKLGGFSRFDPGLSLHLRAGTSLSLFAEIGMFETWLAPKASSSQSMRLAMRYIL